jgi:hypothetical protein
MPSNYIIDLRDLNYPNNNSVDFGQLHQSIFDRYYQSFVNRLLSSGYQLPSVDRYSAELGNPLPATFVAHSTLGTILDPGNNCRWLVFVHSVDGVSVFVARTVVRARDYIQLFGDAADGGQVHLKGEVMVSGVVVPMEDTQRLRSENVRVL